MSDKDHKDFETISNIIENYVQNEKALVDQLYFKSDNHGSTIGGFREDIWKGMFEQIVPKKFVIEQSVFIIDSSGKVSNEVDLAIFDETYTPYIFRYGKIKFLPIEAVAVVIECKSTSLDPSDLACWVKSIVDLRTSRESYTRIINRIVDGSEEPKGAVKVTQSATRPLRILCCLNNKNVTPRTETDGKLFDFIIRASEKEQSIQIETDEEKKDLKEWYLALNHADKDQLPKKGKIEAGDILQNLQLADYAITSKKEGQESSVSLLTLNLQLNQLLMLINNPILFPHKAYAKMFNVVGKGETP